MEQNLDQKIQQAISLSRQRYERDKEDTFYSTIRASETEQLEWFYQRLQQGESKEALLAWLKERLPQLAQQLEEEDEHPTFDWYDEHHHGKRIMGCQDATRRMIALLEQE